MSSRSSCGENPRASHKPRIEDDDIFVHSGAANIVLETGLFWLQRKRRNPYNTRYRTNDTSTDPCSNSEMCLHDNTVTVIFLLRGRLHAAM